MSERYKSTRYSGPAYVTRAEHTLTDGSVKTITSRRHRKGRGSFVSSPDSVAQRSRATSNPWLRLWAPRRLTWWVAVLFFIGSALFSTGGFATTFPHLVPDYLNVDTRLSWIFFSGSLFFTSAAFCQLIEAMNAGDSEGLYDPEVEPGSFQWIAWHPARIGYMASLIQLIGTILFNLNTGAAFLTGLDWVQQNIVVWIPNFAGCICFLIASRLAFMEVCHGYWGWQPGNIEWWITLLNLFGSIGFMISALYGLAVPPGESSHTFTFLSTFFTFQGGVFFLLASYLLLPEMFSE